SVRARIVRQAPLSLVYPAVLDCTDSGASLRRDFPAGELRMQKVRAIGWVQEWEFGDRVTDDFVVGIFFGAAAQERVRDLWGPGAELLVRPFLSAGREGGEVVHRFADAAAVGGFVGP